MVVVRHIVGKIFTFTIIKNQVCCGDIVVMLRHVLFGWCHIELVLAKAAHQGIFFWEKISSVAAPQGTSLGTRREIERREKSRIWTHDLPQPLNCKEPIWLDWFCQKVYFDLDASTVNHFAVYISKMCERFICNNLYHKWLAFVCLAVALNNSNCFLGVFLKMGRPRPLFLYFRLFYLITIGR